MSHELNWQDCRDAATDAAANLAHCYADSIADSREPLTDRDREAWIEEMVKRELRVALRKGLDHFTAEADREVSVTGDQFA